MEDSKSILVSQGPFILTHSFTCVVLQAINNKRAIYKTVASVLYAEISSLALFYQLNYQNSDQKILMEMHAILIVKHLELPFIRSAIIRNLIYSRHIFLWYYIDYFRGNLDFASSVSSHLTILYIFIIFNLITFYRFKTSLERFIYRKDQETAENRLGVIVEACPDGILVASNLETVEYSNLNILKLLSCGSSEIFDVLNRIEYSKGKKYSSLTISNKLSDDINFLFNYEFNKEIMLGISLLGNINIEWKATKILWGDQVAVIIWAKNANQIIQYEQSSAENKIKTVLLRSVSHELRTPINAISFLAQELHADLCSMLPEIQRKKIKMVSISSKLLLSLVNDLLDYSRMLAGVFDIQRSNFNLRKIIYNTSELINIQASKKGLNLSIRVDPDLPEIIFSDPLRLSQVLLNLLSNALKFTMKGSIEVICILTSSNRLNIRVNDTGIGIDPNRLIKLFEEFETEISPIINPQGCGLGLHISNRIVKALNGNPIQVSSTLGAGSAFSFSISISDDSVSDSFSEVFTDLLPENEEKKSEIKVKQFLTHKEKILNCARVLIVDDNEFNRIITGSLLARNSINFDEACNGREAVDCVSAMDKRGRQYNVLIMDCNMPELNGWEATLQIHVLFNEGSISEMPKIIGHSAYSSREDIQLCLESGMTEVLVKPCSPEEILSAVKKYL